uniref:Uncharacterized protein n=1 Tax=Anguilla anguilla TaxID=7936 RepID=A0A0E9RJE7_ANGAN
MGGVWWPLQIYIITTGNTARHFLWGFFISQLLQALFFLKCFYFNNHTKTEIHS